MGRKKIVKEKELLAAIADSRGFYSVIAERLGVAWATVKSAVEESDAAQLAIRAEEEKTLDFVEGKAIARIKADDGAMIRFYLATKGKKRGYTYEERIEDNDAENDEPLQVICDGEEVDPQPINAETETAQPNAEADA
jgi:hypothetical protein